MFLLPCYANSEPVAPIVAISEPSRCIVHCFHFRCESIILPAGSGCGLWRRRKINCKRPQQTDSSTNIRTWTAFPRYRQFASHVYLCFVGWSTNIIRRWFDRASFFTLSQISSEAERQKASDIRVQRDLHELRLTQLSKSARNEIQRMVSSNPV